ncbi:MAG: DUF3791 domain-containing protein [Muribaculaceae bacterium]|nr:DUF3791 domain-containing protein [Muribaculaceae bacterium]
MEKVKDPITGENWIQHNKEEMKIGFLAQCIEELADRFGIDYLEMFKRLETVNLTEGYILKHYETLHTESWDNIMDELSGILKEKESTKQPTYV